MSSSPSTRNPLLLSVAFVAAGLIVGLAGGLGSGSLIGALVAACGAIPGGYAAWVGMQQETQASLGVAILMIIASLGVGALLLILWIVSLVR